MLDVETSSNDYDEIIHFSFSEVASSVYVQNQLRNKSLIPLKTMSSARYLIHLMDPLYLCADLPVHRLIFIPCLITSARWLEIELLAGPLVLLKYSY